MFFYGKKKAAIALLIGLAGAALSVWVIVTGADYGVFSGGAATGFATVVLGVSLLMILIGVPRLVFEVVLITVDSEGLRARNRLGRMKNFRWDQLRWIEHPTKNESCFSGVGPLRIGTYSSMGPAHKCANWSARRLDGERSAGVPVR